MPNYIKHDTKMAEMIKKLRAIKGLSRATLAEQVGVSENHIAKIEAGIKRPGIDTYEKIMSAFEADITVRLKPDTLRGECMQRVQNIMERYPENKLLVLTNIFENTIKEIDKL